MNTAFSPHVLLLCGRAGRTTIRAFGASERFAREQARLTDENHVYNLAALVSARFLSYCVDLVCNLFVTAAVIFVVVGRDAAELTAGRAGVAIAYAITVRPPADSDSHLAPPHPHTYTSTSEVLCFLLYRILSNRRSRSLRIQWCER